MENFQVTKQMLENLGTGSLVGHVMAAFDNTVPKELRLVFELSSMRECRERGGPEEFILIEHSPLCLAQGIQTLIRLCDKLEITDTRNT